jgi:hypothetical protein
MWKSVHQTALTLVALMGLASGIACLSHVSLGPGPAEPTDHAMAGHEHHDASHSTGTPVPENTPDTCCVPRLADSPTSGPVHPIPHAVLVASAIEKPRAVLPKYATRATTYKPPGWIPPLDQTSILLI